MVNVSNIIDSGMMSYDRALEMMHVRLMKTQQRIADLETKESLEEGTLI